MDNAEEQYDLITVLWRLEFKGVAKVTPLMRSWPPMRPGGWVVSESYLHGSNV